jgi:F-type H+-transporting ATPase subunit b
MTIDFWTLGLQAINVAVLIWLLSRVFWTPIAAAIAARQTATQTALDDAADVQAKADAALADVTQARAGIAAERTAALAEAAREAEAQSKQAAAAAQTQADTLLAAATATAKAKTEADSAAANAASATLAVSMARKLLAGLDTQVVQAAFLDRLVAGIAEMTPSDRAALVATPGGVDLVSPDALDATAQAKVTAAVHKALGGKPDLHFVTDPALIAGGELRTAHFTLHNSWRADLDDIAGALTDAA